MRPHSGGVQLVAPPFWHRHKGRVLASPLGCRFAAGAFWSIVGAVVSRGLTLLASICVARLFGKASFGELGMIQSTVGTVGTFAGLGLGMAATKYLAGFRLNDPAKAGRILALSSLLSLLTASMVSIALISTASLVAARLLHCAHLSLPLAIGAGLVFFGVLNGVQTGALAGFEAFQAIARINMLTGLCSFPLLLLGARFWGVAGAVGGMVLTLMVNWGLNSRALRRLCRESGVRYSFRDCWSESPILWVFLLPAALSGFLTAPIIWYSNLLLIDRPNGYAELGVFSAAQQWQAAILFLPISLSPLVLSLMANSHGEGKTQSYWSMVRLSLVSSALIAGLAALAVSLLSPFIMGAYGKEFGSGSLVLTLLALTAVFIASSSVIGQVIASSASMWWGFILNLVWGVVYLGFARAWVGPYGAGGMAAAYLASYLCHLVWTGAYLRHARRKEPAPAPCCSSTTH